MLPERLNDLLRRMTPQECEQVETFAEFLLERRPGRRTLLNDDISIQEMTKIVAESRSFYWLKAEGEDVYSIQDGEEVRWPTL